MLSVNANSKTYLKSIIFVKVSEYLLNMFNENINILNMIMFTLIFFISFPGKWREVKPVIYQHSSTCINR